MPDAALLMALKDQGLTPADLAWLDRLEWDPAAIPAAEPGEIADYRRREAALNAANDGLTFAERGEALAGKLAAAIGARVANATDEKDEDEDDDA
jgi:hypothetical protein